MPAKSCRHVAQALRLSDFRRALKARESFSCDICAKQPNAAAPTPEDARRSWERSAAWEDLCACVSCGFVACLSGNHFAQHVQLHAKHFVGFYAGAQSFWCAPCKHELSDASAKVEDARRECHGAFDEIASKQQRRQRSRVALAAAKEQLAPEPTAAGGIVVASADDTAESSELTKPRRSKKREKQAAPPPPADGPEPPRPEGDAATALSAVSSVLGFTNVGNTCYFNAATQALLTAAHYFPEHVHYAASLEPPARPVLATFSMLHETIKKKTRRRSASSAAVEKDASAVKAKGSKARRGDDRPDGVLTVAPLLKEMRAKFAQFRGSYQQDAHELLLSFLWAIDEEADPPAAASASSSSSGGVDVPSTAAADDSELKQIFIKTDGGDTISMQVPLHATVAELQQLIAKRLNISEDDMALTHSRASSVASSARKSEAAALRPFSKLNFTRNLFGGELTTVITCQACGNQSKTVEDAFQLSLPVPSTTARSLSMIDCLENFMSETELLVAAKNGYDCEKCSRAKATASSAAAGASVELRDAKLRLVVSQLPRVLVVHLKRLGRLKKVTQHIQFDSFMEMAPYTDESIRNAAHAPTCYELVAVVVHMGNKRSGHYVAYVSRSRKRDAQTVVGRGAELPPDLQLDSDDDFDPRAEIHTSENPSRSWYYISDTVVRRVAFEQVLQCEAYMLFYRQLPNSSSSSSASS